MHMQQKHVVILVILLLVVGLGYAGVNAVNQSKKSDNQDQIGIDSTPIPEPQSASQNIEGLNSSPVSGSSTNQAQPSGPTIKKYQKFPGVLPADQLENKTAVITTDKGVIEFEIFPEAPKAASNFIFLAKDGFYNGLKFHRVVPGFVIQGGDPLSGILPNGDPRIGSSGPGYQFEDEPVTKKYNKGIVAMANAGPNTNGSQFFIMLEDNPTLPPNYTIFGMVTKGQEVVDQIKAGDIIRSVTIR